MREAEKTAGRKPDPAMDAFLKAQTLEGGDESIVTDYMLKLLGLDVSLDAYPCSVCVHFQQDNHQYPHTYSALRKAQGSYLKEFQG